MHTNSVIHHITRAANESGITLILNHRLAMTALYYDLDIASTLSNRDELRKEVRGVERNLDIMVIKMNSIRNEGFYYVRHVIGNVSSNCYYLFCWLKVPQFRQLSARLEVMPYDASIRDWDVFFSNINTFVEGVLRSVSKLKGEITECAGLSFQTAKDMETISHPLAAAIQDLTVYPTNLNPLYRLIYPHTYEAQQHAEDKLIFASGRLLLKQIGQDLGLLGISLLNVADSAQHLEVSSSLCYSYSIIDIDLSDQFEARWGSLFPKLTDRSLYKPIWLYWRLF